MSTIYNLYAAPWGNGKESIDFTSPLLTATSLPLTAQGIRGSTTNGTRFLCLRRAVDGIEEQNFNIVEFTVSNGEWVANYPAAPYQLRGVIDGQNKVNLYWKYQINGTIPEGFHVYAGVGTVDYSSPLASVAFDGGLLFAELPSITTTTLYGVRAYRGGHIELNTDTVSVAALSDLAEVTSVATATWKEE